jgi:hypothetical protein
VCTRARSGHAQGSACIYSKKVELLYTLVFHTLDMVTQQKRSAAAKSSSLKPNGEDADIAFQEENFLELDDVLQEVRCCGSVALLTPLRGGCVPRLAVRTNMSASCTACRSIPTVYTPHTTHHPRTTHHAPCGPVTLEPHCHPLALCVAVLAWYADAVRAATSTCLRRTRWGQ